MNLEIVFLDDKLIYEEKIRSIKFMVCLTSNKIDTKLVSEALKALGKDNFALIIHGSSFPSKMVKILDLEHSILQQDAM